MLHAANSARVEKLERREEEEDEDADPMQNIYLTEIHSDDEPDLEHDGEEVEQLEPIEVPLETLTATQVAAAKKAAAPVPAGGRDEQAAERARQSGNTAFGAGRFDEAVAAYTEAIGLWPAGAGLAFGNRSAAQLKLQRVEPAISDATEMVHLLPELAKSHFRLGSALAAGGRHAEAAGAFAEMLRLDPGSEAAEEALRKQMASGNLKKNKKHARLLQTCNEALTARRAHEKSAAAAAAAAAEPPPPPRGPPLRLQWGKLVVPARGTARPAKRSGATLSAVGGRLWLLGGADREAQVYGDVWEYVPPPAATPPSVSDGGGGGWVLHSAASAPPFTPRAAHAAAARAADSLLLFGGHNPHTSTLHGELLELRVGRRGELDAPPAWRQPAIGGVAPDARNGHSLTWDAEGSAALLFGGADEEGHRNDLHALHIIVGGEGLSPEAETWEWRNPLCTGAPPPAREMHTAALLGRTLLIHGGRGGPHAAAALDELSVLCLRSLTWSSAPTRLARSGHCATPLPRPAAAAAATEDADADADAAAMAPRCLLLGGFDGGSVKHDAWQLVLPAGAAAGGTVAAADVIVERGRSEDAPPGRFSHAACVLEAVLEGGLKGGQQRAGGTAELFLFGGSSFEEELDDLVPATLG